MSAEGGKATKLTLADGASADATRAWPVFLPDGTHFLYVRGVFRGAIDDYRVCVGQLGSPDATCLMQSDSRVEYAPPGRLLFVRKGTLLTQLFDAGKRRVSGQPTAIADRIAAVGPTGSARLRDIGGRPAPRVPARSPAVAPRLDGPLGAAGRIDR